MIALPKLLSFLGQHRGFLTLFLVAGMATGLWAAYANVRAERDDILAMAELICASAGSTFETDKGTPGEPCARKVKLLAAFRSDTQAATAQRLIAVLQEREDKQSRDAERRAAALEAQRAAATAMIHAEEQVHDDQVNGSWFAALNRVAGLRPASR